MMGAGGIAEAIACIRALNTGLLPGNYNLSTPGVDLPLLWETETRTIRAAMTNAFGFGGQNSSLVLRRWS